MKMVNLLNTLHSVYFSSVYKASMRSIKGVITSQLSPDRSYCIG